jgi:outer membrane immunogenic protein
MFTRLTLAASFVGVSLAALTTGAVAADLPSRRAVTAPYIAPLPTWTGFYVGATAGYDFWNKLTVKPNGFAVGLRAGYDYQFSNNIVVGLLAEGDYNFGRKSYSGVSGVTPYTATFKHRDTFSLDARLGYAIDSANLAYVVGGYTRADLKLNASIGGVTGTLVGGGDFWNIGAGFEHKFTQNVSGFAEYRFNKDSKSKAADFSEIKLGVNYRF